MANQATNVAANNAEDLQDRKRYLLLGKIRTDGEKYLTLKLHDKQHTWHNIPLGRVKPSSKGAYDKDKNVIIPVFPLLHATVDRSDKEYRNVQKGWLYIFKNGHLWRELEVASHAMLTDVNLRYEQGKNERKATGERDWRVLVPHKIDGKVNDIRIAYSEVQWSWGYICSLGGMDEKNDTRYKEELHSGRAYGEDYSKVAKNSDQYNKRLDKIDLSEYKNNFQNKVIRSNTSSVVLNIKDLEGRLKNKPEVKMHLKGEFAAVILDDPIGIAHNYATQLNHKWDYMHKFIASLETGNPAGALHGKQKKQDPQIKAQFDMAAIMYQVGFSNKENKDKYGDDLNLKRLEMLLGVKERKKLRKEIKQLRDKLVKTVKGEAYQKAILDYTTNIPELQLAGKGTIAYHNQYMAMHPHEFDLHLDIPDNIDDDITEKDEAWEYLADTLTAKNDAGALLYAEIESNISDRASKVNAILGKLLEGFRKLAVSDVKYLKAATYIINSFHYLGVDLVEVRKIEFNPKVPEGYKTVARKIRTEFVEKVTVKQQVLGYPDIDGVARVQFGEAQIYVFPPQTNITQPGQEITISSNLRHVEQIVEKEKPLNRFLNGIESTNWYSKGYLGLIGIFEVINFASAVKQINQKGLDGREVANLIGAVAGTLNFLGEWKRLRLKLLAQNPTPFLNVMIKYTARIAPLFGAITSGMDTYSNYRVRDYDAALWHSGAAISSLVLFALVGSTMIAIPILLIAFGIFAGIMAAMAEDDPLEIFSKHAHFQEKGGVATGGNIWEKIRKQAEKPIYTEGDFDEWKILTKAKDELFNMMYGVVPYMAISYDTPTFQGYYKDVVVQANKVRVKVKFKRFELVSSRLDYRLRVYPKGLKSVYLDNKPYIELRPDDMDYKVHDEFGGIKHILMTFNLPKKLTKDLNDDSEIIFICRELINSRSEHFMPTPDEYGELRYYAIRRPGTKAFYQTQNVYHETVQSSNKYRSRFGKIRRMGLLNEIEDPGFWVA